MNLVLALILVTAGAAWPQAPKVSTVTIAGELAAEVPDGWLLDDQWFREIPVARLYEPARPSGPSLSIERYTRDNPLKLTPQSFPATLTTRRSKERVKKQMRKAGGRSFAVYELRRPPVRARPPDADEFFDVLGPGRPGIRSKLERCRDLGAWRLVPAYMVARKDPGLLADFRKTILDDRHESRFIETCLGFATLARMRRNEPIEPAPQAPEEAEIARLEDLEKGGGEPAATQAVTVIEAADRFYVLRYSAPADSYQAGLPIFDRFLATFRVLSP